MTTEPKYYTPTEEEFHVGFPFELKYLKEGWQPEIFAQGEKAFHSIGHLRASTYNCPWEEVIRVRYLDREGIEECGWVYDNEDFDGIQWKIGEFYLTVFKIVNNVVSDWTDVWIEKCIETDTAIKGYECSTVFEGILKNKSELLRIMKQVGIK